MEVPFLSSTKAVDENGHFVDDFFSLMTQLLQNMRQAIGNEGFLPPAQTKSNMLLIQAGAQPGTILFVSDEINGGSSDTPNGQLYIRLNDGLFHAIPNL